MWYYLSNSMLLKLSKLAEHIHETWQNKYLANKVSYSIWTFVEVLARITNDQERVMDVLGQRGLIFKAEGKYKRALDIFRKCLEIAKENKNPHAIQVYLSEVAIVLILEGKAEEALPYAQEAVEIAEKNAPEDICHQLTHLGRAYMELGNYEEAEKALSRANTIAKDEKEKVSHPAQRAGAMIAYAELLRKEGKEKVSEELLADAKAYCQQRGLQRRLEQISALKY